MEKGHVRAALKSRIPDDSMDIVCGDDCCVTLFQPHQHAIDSIKKRFPVTIGSPRMLILGIADLLQSHASIPDDGLWLTIVNGVNAQHDTVNVL